MKLINRNSAAPSLQFWGLSAFLCLAAFTGGGTRLDIQSSAILLPAAVLTCFIALISLRRDQLRGQLWFILLLSISALLVLVHILPLPTAIWSLLPGRQLVAQIDQLAGLGATWRPLTLTPINGIHSLTAFFSPLAVFLVGVQLSREDLYRLLLVMLGLGLTSSVFGLLQVAGGTNGPLYLYDITSSGYAVGLFANRNHAATQIACMFPMLAVFASSLDPARERSKAQLKLIVAFTIAVMLMPLVLMTGSRSGTFLAMLGIVGAALVYRNQQLGSQRERRVKALGLKLRLGLVALFLLMLTGLSMIFTRAVAIDRFMTQSNIDDVRFEYWRIALEMFWKYFPFGSGAGSFSEAFQIDEPAHLLANTYLNRAHNDWLETAVTFGLPGLAILLFAVLAYLKRSKSAWLTKETLSRSTLYARMASISIGLIGLASVTDYPLRTPAMMCFLVVFVLWLNLPSVSYSPVESTVKVPAVNAIAGRSNASRHSKPKRQIAPWINRLSLSALGAGALFVGWLAFALAVSGIARNKAPATALKFVPFEASALASRADQLFFANPTRPPKAAFQLATDALKLQAINPKSLRLLGFQADLRGDQSKAAEFMHISQIITRRDTGTQLWLLEQRARSGDLRRSLAHYDIVLTTKPEMSTLLFPRLLNAISDGNVRNDLVPHLIKSKDWTTNFLEFSISSTSDLPAVVALIEQIGGVPASNAQNKLQNLLLERLIAENRYGDARRILDTIIKSSEVQVTNANFRYFDLTGHLGIMGWQIDHDPNGGASFIQTAGSKKVELNIFVNSATTKRVASRLLYLKQRRYTFYARTSRLDPGSDGFLRWKLRCAASKDTQIWATDSISASLNAEFMIPANCPVQFLDLIASGGEGQTGLEATVASVSITPSN